MAYIRDAASDCANAAAIPTASALRITAPRTAIIACATIASQLQASGAMLAIADGQGRLSSIAHSGVAPAAEIGRDMLELYQGIAHLSAHRHGGLIAIEDTSEMTDDGLQDLAAHIADASIAAAMFAPVFRDGKIAAALIVFSAAPRCWTRGDRFALTVAGERSWAQIASASMDALPQPPPTDVADVFGALHMGYCLCEMLTGEHGGTLDFRYLRINAVFAAMTGLTEAVGRTAREIDPEIDRDRLEQFARVALAGGTFEFVQISKTEGRSFTVMAMPAPAPAQFHLVYRETTDSDLQSQALQRSQAVINRQSAELEAIYEAAPVGLVMFDRDFRFVRVNKRLADFNRFSAAEHVGRPIEDILPAPTAKLLRSMQAKLEAGESISDLEVTAPDPLTGEMSSWLVSYEPRRDASGDIAWYIGSVLDITDRKRFELELRNKNAELETVLDAVPAAVWIARDPECRVITSNRAGAKILQLPTGANASKSAEYEAPVHFEIFSGGRRLEPPELPIQRAAASGADVIGVEETIVFADGQERTLYGNASPLFDINGDVRGAVGAFIDISDLAQARAELASSRAHLEEAVIARTAELREQQGRLRSIFETSFTFQFMLDLKGTLIDANATALEAIDKESAVIGSPFWETPWFTGSPGVPQMLRDWVYTVADGRSAKAEVSLNLPVGGCRWFEFQMRPLRSGSGEIVGIVAEAAETTARRDAEEALRHAHKMEAIGQLTGGVAHDFNNLLTVIRAACDMLKTPHLPDEKRHRYIEAISDTTDRAVKLTNQLLAFARRQLLESTVFDVGARVQGVGEMLATVLGAQVAFAVAIPSTPLLVAADISQFETALINLAANARDAMNGQGELRVRVYWTPRAPGVSTAPDAGFVAIALQDNGCGIPRDQIGHVFEPFFTTKDIGQGTGLGLSQVYGFARQSGGSVSVESEIGQGSIFTLYLPRTTDQVEPVASDAPVVEANAKADGSILVVEDSAHVGAIVCQVLEQLGYRTHLTRDAIEAMAALHEDAGRFDLVFSDVMMPGVSGAALGRQIREQFPDLPVVLTSGYSDDRVAEDRLGMKLLQKPYSVASLAATIARAINRSERA